MLRASQPILGRPGLEWTFWLAAAACVLARLALTSDLSVEITFAPWDDSLYVKRAHHLLAGEAFGPYDGRLLGKYPGISLWIAGVRMLGIPFLVSVNALYVGAGVYFAAALLRCGVSRWLVLVSFALYLFNPITFGYEWIRAIREPLATGLMVLMIAAIAHVLAGLREGRVPWGHLAVFAPVFAFSLFVREDDRLLWALPVLFAAAVTGYAARRRPLAPQWMVFAAAAVIAPAMLGAAYEYALRAYIERHYGLPTLHELSEGEYPRLLAAIRSIRTAKDNRMVMVPQAALEKLRTEAPSFGPVVDRLPKPHGGTWSCELHGVCSEWSNGWIPFMIKDEAFRAGLTPNLAAGQAYFKRVRSEIERACSERRLACIDKGTGLVPPMELRWTRAYLSEGWRIAKLALAPDNNAIPEVPVTYRVPLELGRLYQAATMTDYFDTELQSRLGERPASRLYVNPLADLRATLRSPYLLAGSALIIAALAALAARSWIAHRLPLGPLALAAWVFVLYSAFKLAALSYVAVFMGGFTARLVFPTYAVLIILALPLIAEAILAIRGTPRRNVTP